MNSQNPANRHSLTLESDIISGTDGKDLFFAQAVECGENCQGPGPCVTLGDDDWIDGGSDRDDPDVADELFAHIDAGDVRPHVSGVEEIRIQALAPTEASAALEVAHYDAALTEGASYIENVASNAPLLISNVPLSVDIGVVEAKGDTTVRYADADGLNDGARLRVTGDAGTVTINNIDILEVSAHGGASKVDISADALHQLIIDGNDGLAITIGESGFTLTQIDAHNQAGPLTLTATEGRGLTYFGGQADTTICLQGDGHNSILTGDGNDRISMGGGHDRLNTGKGHDQIAAGSGTNLITTGDGHDVVYILSPSDSTQSINAINVTTITDFDSAKDKLAFNFERSEGSSAHVIKTLDIGKIISPLPQTVHKAALLTQLAANGVDEGSVYTFTHRGATYVGVNNQDATLVQLVGLVDIGDNNICYGTHCLMTGGV